MRSEVKQDVIDHLNKVFPEFKIYDQVQPQGTAHPCFVIRPIQVTRTPAINATHKVHVFVSVLFVANDPKGVGDINELERVQDVILFTDAFRFLNSKYHIFDLQAQHDGSILHITFRLDYEVVLEATNQNGNGALMEKVFIRR